MALNSRKFVTLKDRLNPNYCLTDKTAQSRRVFQFDVGQDLLALNVRNGPNGMLQLWFRNLE